MGKIKALMETSLGKPDGVASLDSNGKLKQMPTAEEVWAVPTIVKYYSGSADVSPDDIIDPLVLLSVSATVNAELYNVVGGTFAYVRTMFYGGAETTRRRVQVAYSYNASPHRMAFRIYGANGWQAWKEIATTDSAIMKTNKPSGSYTGNGSAASRTVNVGGIGNVIEIHSSKGSAIVNAVNGLCYSSAGVAVVASTQAKMVDGVLTLATNNDKLNANGVTYYYQVL